MELKKFFAVTVIALFLVAFIPDSPIKNVYADFDSIDLNIRLFVLTTEIGGTGLPQIPTGWELDHTFTDLYIGGIDNNPNTILGGALHNHSMNNHTHDGGSHTHDFTGASAAGTQNFIETSARPSAKVAVAYPHGHTAKTSTAGTMETENDGGYLVENGGNTPPYVKVYIIKPIDENQEIPIGSSVFNLDQTIPDGYKLNDTFSNKFLLFTNVTGDALTTGGLFSHGHNFADHSHDLKLHDHADFSSGSASPTYNAKNPITFPTPTTPNTVHHTIAVTQEDAGETGNQTIIVNLASSLPDYIILGLMQKNETSFTTPINLTVPFVGNRSSIPDGWELVNQTYERFIFIANSTSFIGETGGLSIHSHTDNDHDHDFPLHNHSASDIDFFITNTVKGGAVAAEKNSFHSHVWTSTQTSGTLNSYGVNTTFSDNRPDYKEVLFIRYTGTCEFYPSPNVEKSCSNNCSFPNPVDFDGGNLTLFGEGVITLEAKFTNIDFIIKENTCLVIMENGIGEVELI